MGVTQKRAGRHFGFLKRAGRHQKAAGRPALRKRPRQNTGIEGLQRLNASTLTDEDKKDPAKIYKLFDDQLDPNLFRKIAQNTTEKDISTTG